MKRICDFQKKIQRSECNQPFAPQEGHFVHPSREIVLNNSIWRAPKGAKWSDRKRIWSAKRDPIQGQPSAFRAHRCPLRSANHWFALGKLMIPWFEGDKRCGRAVRRPNNAHRDPSPAVEQQRSTEIERCLTSVVALNEPRAGIELLVQPLLGF